MRIASLFHGLQAPRGRASWGVANQYRESSRVRCGGDLWYCGDALKAFRARARMQGEVTVYENPFTLSRFSSTLMSDELVCCKSVSR